MTDAQLDSSSPRPNFRTLFDVFQETARLLYSSAEHLKRLSARTSLEHKSRMVLDTLAEARLRAAEHLMAYEHDPAQVTKTWVQYGRLFKISKEFEPAMQRADSESEMLETIRSLDDELTEGLSALAMSYHPPLEACEKASALVMHVKRASSAIMNTSHDV